MLVGEILFSVLLQETTTKNVNKKAVAGNAFLKYFICPGFEVLIVQNNIAANVGTYDVQGF
jgi:hypothetical protein